MKTGRILGTCAFLLTTAAPFAHAQTFWSQSSQGLRCAIVAAQTELHIGQDATFMFIVNNPTDKTIAAPVPSSSTLSFNALVTEDNKDRIGFEGHIALASSPASREEWTQIAPGQSLIYSFTYGWKRSDVVDVYFTYASTVQGGPFQSFRTPTLRVTIR